MLHSGRLFEDDWVNKLPRWNGQGWVYPSSHMLVTDLWAYFSDVFPANEDFVAAYRGFEYRIGLIQEHTPGYHAISGEYVGEWAWDGDTPKTETTFRRQLARSRSDAWQRYYGGVEELESALLAQREVLKRYQRW